jgi:hypothetical protein
MKRSLMSRVDRLQRLFAAQGRVRCLWQETGETMDMIRARIRAEIATGKASEIDRFVVFGWGRPGGDGT